ncbi:class I SAM-dependent DNA methyltransferase [Streptomyces specialis]|uniref:class I SAM-dependent DNA methyltransferase n=1 Tax=Streptomyces specialis TaxID=498367 RepID=UPI00073EE6CD|nr:class I SAM-dependent methyltransferase [Streptomyces specialis]
MTEPAFLRATRASWDALAADYAERSRHEPASKPLARAMLGAFAETVRTGPVVDAGSGPGHVTAFLAALGLDIRGIDLSPGMVAEARRAHPGLRFDVGTMTALDLPDGALAGLVAWYSIIHVPPDRLPGVFGEFHRVLASGGRLLLAFQVGDEPRHVTEVFGHPVTLDFHRLRPARVAELLERTGFVVDARLERAPDASERSPQAHILAHRP